MRAWLTLSEIPAEKACRYLRIPDDWQWEACFRGALLLLTETENWEQYGALSPEEMADAWADVLWDYIENATGCEGGSGLDTGTVVLFAGDTVPPGWLRCDGALYSKDQYPDLFDVIGYIYGGNGDYFKVPDLRGRVLVGAGSGQGLTPRYLGDTGGEETHTLTESELPPISQLKEKNAAGTDGQYPARGSAAAAQYTANMTGAWPTLLGHAHNNMPPYLVLEAIIKA
jgi:microcystin-dependent protein